MDLQKVDVEIKWPFKLFLGGGSGVGKTTFCVKFIKNLKKICGVSPSHIFLLYNEYQSLYDEIKNINEFKFIPIKGIPLDLEDRIINLGEYANPIVIVDDQFLSQNLQIISDFFLVKSRHLKPPSSFIFLSQSLFGGGGNRGKLISLISSNSTHITIFRTSRMREAYTLFEQILQKNSKVLKSIFDKITQEKFTYLFIDCTSYSELKYRFKSHLFDKYIRVYIMDENNFSTMYLISAGQKIQLENIHNNSKEINEKGTLKFSLENSNGICQDGMNVRIKPIIQSKNNNSSTHTRNESISKNSMNEGGYFSATHPDEPRTPPIQYGSNPEYSEMSENPSTEGIITPFSTPIDHTEKSDIEHPFNSPDTLQKNQYTNTQSPSFHDKSTNTWLPKKIDNSSSTPKFYSSNKSSNTHRVIQGDNSTNTPLYSSHPLEIGHLKNRESEQEENFISNQSENNNFEREDIPDESLLIPNSKIKRIEEEVNKFIPDQNNEHKSLIKIKNIIPHSKNNTPVSSTTPLSKKKKRVLPQWIIDSSKNPNENIIPSEPPPSLQKKKRVLPRWITDLPKKKGGRGS